MANFLNRFSNQNPIPVVSSAIDKGVIYDYTPKISPSGDFGMVRNLETIINSWNNILMTPRGTYIDDPTYGSRLVYYIFEEASNDTMDSIKSEIYSSIQTVDNRAAISNINVQFISNKKGFVIDVTVQYNGDKKSLKLIMNENTYFNLLRTE